MTFKNNVSKIWIDKICISERYKTKATFTILSILTFVRSVLNPHLPVHNLLVLIANFEQQ